MSAHAIMRAHERYGETFTCVEIDAVLHAVEEGRAIFMRTVRSGREMLVRSPLTQRWMRAIIIDDEGRLVVATFIAMSSRAKTHEAKRLKHRDALAASRFDLDDADLTDRQACGVKRCKNRSKALELRAMRRALRT